MRGRQGEFLNFWWMVWSRQQDDKRAGQTEEFGLLGRKHPVDFVKHNEETVSGTSQPPFFPSLLPSAPRPPAGPRPPTAGWGRSRVGGWMRSCGWMDYCAPIGWVPARWMDEQSPQAVGWWTGMWWALLVGRRRTRESSHWWSSVVCFLGSSSEGSVNGGFIGAYDGELDGTLREWGLQGDQITRESFGRMDEQNSVAMCQIRSKNVWYGVFHGQDWSPRMSFILKGAQILAFQLKGWFKSKMSIQECRNEIQNSH